MYIHMCIYMYICVYMCITTYSYVILKLCGSGSDKLAVRTEELEDQDQGPVCDDLLSCPCLPKEPL